MPTSETWMSAARNSAPILKRAVIEFRFQLIAAIGWAGFQAYNSPDKQISIFISQFFMAFFFVSFFVGQFFRIKHQQNLLDQLKVQSGQIGRLETTISTLPSLIADLKVAKAPAPFVNALSAISDTASSEITGLRSANSASTMEAAHLMSWWNSFDTPLVARQPNPSVLESASTPCQNSLVAAFAAPCAMNAMPNLWEWRFATALIVKRYRVRPSR